MERLKKRNWGEWFAYAGIRAIKTVAQTALGFVCVGMALHEVDWVMMGSVSIVAGIASLLTSLAGIPELKEEVE